MGNGVFVPKFFPASVKTVSGTKWGYINNAGQFAIKPKYEDASDFQENGLAIVRLESAGVINQKGRFVVPPKYSSILPFSEGRAVVMEEGQGSKVINEAGKVLTGKAYTFISPYQEQRAVFQENNVYGYLDRNGREIIPAKYLYAFDFQSGKALVQVKDSLYALIDRNGRQLQTYPYEQMNGLSEGLIPYKKTYQDKAGYVNEAGTVVISPRFAMALPFQDGRAVVNMSEDYKNQYGLIDKTGAYVIKPIYNDIELLGGKRAAVGKAINVEQPYVGSVYAIADSESGRFLTDFIYDSVNNYQGEYSSVTQGLNSFFIDRTGKRASTLPVIKGIGSLNLEGNLIKAFVDQRLSYYDKNDRIVWKQNTIIPISGSMLIREGKYRPNKDYLVYYPQIEGMPNKPAQSHVNKVLKEKSQLKPIPETKQLDYSYTGDFSVKFFQKDLLVLELVGYNSPFGAAHGMPSQVHVPINLKSGTIYQLKDLFKPDSNYVKALSQKIEKRIKEKPDSYFVDQYKGIKADQPFYVTKDSVAIYFQPYEIAPYAAGFPTFEIPYNEVMNLIDVEGEFWRSFH